MSSFHFTTKTSTLSSSLDAKGSLVSVDAANNNKEWALGSDVFPCCHEMSPMDEAMQAGMSSVQPGLDGHLPLLHARHHGAQDGLLFDLSSPTAYLDSGSLEYSDTDGNNAGPLFERRKRSRSNSSRHRFSEVVTELGPEEVRWFYKEDKKTWKPFLGHDSLKIELTFRKYCELNPGGAGSQGGGEEEECGGNNGVETRGLNAAVPVETRTSSVHGGRGSLDTSTVSSDERDPDSIEINVEPVCVRGGLYEVDVKERECNPVYWKREYHKKKTKKTIRWSMPIKPYYCFASVTSDVASLAGCITECMSICNNSSTSYILYILQHYGSMQINDPRPLKVKQTSSSLIIHSSFLADSCIVFAVSLTC